LQAGSDLNPYAPPAEHADVGYSFDGDAAFPLATLSQRWWGALLDNLFYLLSVVPAFVIAKLAGEGAIAWLPLVLVLSVLPMVAYQAVLISRTGQSLGKKLLKTRIVKLDGSVPGFVHGVLVRSWAVGVVSAIPYLGSLVSLADLLMIFRRDRRMLHDHIAGTNVIQVL
jgi:uncharacterized RDD family membrane protein YckC